MGIKVVGAGLGRTGTGSLKMALERLGYAQCYHFSELIAHPEHVTQWEKLSQGRSVDWTALFDGYQAVVDYPGCCFYKEILQAYQDAKVILTVRDPERWYNSTLKTLYNARPPLRQLLPLLLRMPFSSKHRMLPRVVRLYHRIAWKGLFGGRFEEKDHALAVYQRHSEEVQCVVPSNQLLIYQVEEGWGPLCEFLGQPVPVDEPFPHQNMGGDFRQMQQAMFRSVSG
ncbi:MAG: sulfotransferase family protein [Anaerolineae bacterium]|nr:sulfotransferase family protein [Anaerolineae bacterium]